MTTESSAMTYLHVPFLRRSYVVLICSFVELVLVHERLRICGRTGGCSRSGKCAAPCTDTINSDLLLWKLLLLKKIAQHRDVPQPGDFVHDIGDSVVHQSGYHETLPILQFEFSFRLARAQGWTVKPEIVKALAKSSVLTSGTTSNGYFHSA